MIIINVSIYGMETKHPDCKGLKKQPISVTQKDTKSEQIEEIDTSKAGAFAQIPPELIAHILSFILIEDASDSSKLVKSLCRAQNFKSVCTLFEKVITPQLLGRLIKDSKINVNMCHHRDVLLFKQTPDYMFPPLFLAVKKDLKSIVQLLLENGADINFLAESAVWTTSHWRASSVEFCKLKALAFALSPEMIKLLLDKGLEVRKKDMQYLVQLNAQNGMRCHALFETIKDKMGADEACEKGMQGYKEVRNEAYFLSVVLVVIVGVMCQAVYNKLVRI